MYVRVEACLALFSRHKNKGILNCNEKWILFDLLFVFNVFDNRSRSASWLDPGSAIKQCPKRKKTSKKVMVTV
jgi:hypothetical protein